MFKDIYKQANDKIDIESPKSRVMARLQKPTPVVRKSYKAARVAALAACFVLTIAAAGIYENMQKQSETIPQLAVETAGTPVVTREVEDAPVMPTKAPISKKVAESVTKEVKKQIAVSHDEIVQEEKAEYMAEISVDSAATPPQEEKISSGGGGGSSAKADSALVINEANGAVSDVAAARFAMPAKEERYVSVQEYCEEIGKDIPLVVDLPEGVEDQTIPVQPIWADEDKFTFTFMGDGKMVQIEATKNTDEVQEILDNPAYEKSSIEENSAVVLDENEILRAYLVSDCVGYTVTTINCTEPELIDVLISLN